MKNYAQYLKAIVAFLSPVVIALQTIFPADKWANTVVAAVSAALVFLVPNTPKTPSPANSPKEPVTQQAGQ